MPADSLQSLREQIASLRVIRCRMVHERVRVEGGVVLRAARGGAEPSLVRMGLCSAEVRARNLACGHSMARYALFDAVRALRLPDAAHDALREELDSVHNAIHLLDHQKGEAERQLALSSEMKDGASEAARWAAEIRRLEEQHDLYAEQIREIQRAVLAHLDAAIRDSDMRDDEPVPPSSVSLCLCVSPVVSMQIV